MYNGENPMQEDALTLTQDALLDLLSRHADALNQNERNALRLLQKQRSPLPSDALALLALARELKQLLVPLGAPQPFRRELRRQLTSTPQVTLAGMGNNGRLPDLARRVGAQAAGNRPLLVGAAALGSILPLLGLLFFWRKRQRTEPLPGAV
jgi:hypothetical protein